MPNIELTRTLFGISSVDINLDLIGGQIAVYREDGIKKAIRIGCERIPKDCPSFNSGECVADIYENNTGDPFEVGCYVICGKTKAGIKIKNSISL